MTLVSADFQEEKSWRDPKKKSEQKSGQISGKNKKDRKMPGWSGADDRKKRVTEEEST